MPDEERYERGRAKLTEVHGERALATIESLGDLGRLIIETAYGEVYSRPGLSIRERQIAAVAAGSAAITSIVRSVVSGPRSPKDTCSR